MKHEADKINNYYSEICLVYSYMEIFEEIQDIVLFKENISDPIRAFQDLVSQYIDDKKVCVTPKGISVYLKEDKEMSYISKVYEGSYVEEEFATEKIVFGDIDTEVSLNSLSSGECKIIMLIFYATFSNYFVLIMDEPELSISILWQQRLIVDLLDYGKFANVIVATHSPYIARDNSLAGYIEYLP